MSATVTQDNIADEFVAGNYFDKYRSDNPVHQWLMRRFLRDAQELVQIAKPRDVLETGCGPGDLAASLFRKEDIETARMSYLGTDISPEEIAHARVNCPHFEFQEASIYELPFDADRFDLVIACEVLEHLDTPDVAIAELARVTSRYALVSVPWEPTWRMLNVVRGKYIFDLGNTPGHLQNFSRSAIRRLLSKHFDILEERRPFPWSMFLAKTKPA